MEIVVNINSFVDVITNSSTELFVCNTKKSLDAVKEIINEIIKEYNEKVDQGLFDETWSNGKTSRPRKSSIKDFKEPYIYTEELFQAAVDAYIRNMRWEKRFKIKEYKKYLSVERKNDFIHKRMREIEKFLKDMQEKEIIPDYGYEKRSNIGKIIIESKSDNTIPYDMFDMIRETLNAKSYHLG